MALALRRGMQLNCLKHWWVPLAFCGLALGCSSDSDSGSSSDTASSETGSSSDASSSSTDTSTGSPDEESTETAEASGPAESTDTGSTGDTVDNECPAFSLEECAANPFAVLDPAIAERIGDDFAQACEALTDGADACSVAWSEFFICASGVRTNVGICDGDPCDAEQTQVIEACMLAS